MASYRIQLLQERGHMSRTAALLGGKQNYANEKDDYIFHLLAVVG